MVNETADQWALMRLLMELQVGARSSLFHHLNHVTDAIQGSKKDNLGRWARMGSGDAQAVCRAVDRAACEAVTRPGQLFIKRKRTIHALAAP